MLGSSIKTSKFGLGFAWCAIFVLGGCQGAGKSGTAKFQDSSHLVYFDNTVGASDEMAPAVALVGPIAIQLGLDLAEWFVRGQAKKYAATYGAKNQIVISSILPPGSPPFGKHGTMSQGGAFLFTRIVKIGDETGDQSLDLPRLDENVLAELAKEIATNGGASISESDIIEYFKRIGASEEHVLGLCVMGHISPRTSSDAFELRVVGLTYPLLKSRATNTGVRSFDKVVSQLVVKLDGPATGFIDDNSFSISHAFPLRWDGNIEGYKFNWLEGAAIRSGPILSPRHKDFVLKATVIESSGFQKVLENAADEIDKLDPSVLIGK